jgi:hypothetical protein
VRLEWHRQVETAPQRRSLEAEFDYREIDMHHARYALVPVMALVLLGSLPAAADDADDELGPATPAQEALEEAIHAEQQALKRLYFAHDRVEQLADDDNPQKARAGANDKIVNGLRTSRFPTAGAFLKGDAEATLGSHCTGTLIGCRTFLTARHCVASDTHPGDAAKPAEYAKYRIFLQHAGMFDVAAIATRPDYRFPFADLAVVTLGSAVDGVTPTPINSGTAVAAGTEGIIVGFGRSGGTRSDYGIKRTGFVTTAACDETDKKLVCWDYDPAGAEPGEASNTCNADSGGPLFIEDAAASPSRRVLAGVTSGGTRSDCLRNDHSYDVDVGQFADWIDGQTTDPLGPAACGTLPQWGADDVVMRRGSGTLGATRTSARYAIPVPAGVAVLRVAMNAEDTFGDIDFDLYVRRGAAPTEVESDCRRVAPSQYAFCEFRNPAPGNWHVWIKRKAGDGVFQVTTTQYGG